MKTKQITIKKRIQNKGFTLVELLVSISIFSLIVSAMSGAFVSTIRAQRKSVAFQQLLEQTSYLEEYMSRAIRMARKDLSGDCLTTAGAKQNFETNLDKDRIRFLNYQGICQEFFLEADQIKERKSTDGTAANFQIPLPLTSDDLQVESFKIGPSDSWDQNDNEQPRVTLFLDIKGAGSKPEQQPEIKIQTT
ncbi:unnamed protein product, partial [marine sediment metagenome]